MTPYTLLLPPNLTPREHHILNAALSSARVPRPTQVLPEDSPDLSFAHPVVLSVGKGALDLWHEFNLITISHQHGDTFAHQSRTFYVVEHPGAMLQLQWTGRTARDNMARDLLRFRMLLEGKHTPDELVGQWCGACWKARDPRQRAAITWPVELDAVGLCEDHARRKARFLRKPKPRVNPSKREAQVPGQVEGFAMSDGKMMVAKR